ncbi:flagellin [Lysinibacillus endophyticus]|uniref:flagellin N-terminal helical domain-containing protein n=1 Tax=Ureibacillus endophyticus TaxID=1978490 RepID=UPI003134BF16
MRINHNIAALNTHRQLSSATGAQSKSMEKLSSGLRINRAGDDAAGLAISEKMRGQIRGLDMAAKNAQDGISMIQTAEGALNETHAILQRMRELATQAANDTYTDTDRGEIQKEINQLTSEINRIGNTTEFNTKKLLNGGEGVTGTGTDNTTPNKASFQQVKSTATPTAFDFGTKGADITIGDKTVTLDQDYTDIDGLVAALDGEFEGVKVTKGASGELVFSSASEFTIDVADNGGTGGAAALNITTGTKSSKVDVEYNVSSTATPTAFDFGTKGADITIGDKTVTLDQDYTDIDGLVAALDGEFEGVKVTKGASDELVFTGASEFTIDVADNGGTGGAAALNITTGTKATSNVPTGLDLKTNDAGDGKGFSATFQIGANAGQSMTIDILDMRATSGALKIASENETEVKSNSEKTAKYTEALVVTNGTDNVSKFKALDVSNHANASAAIDVINDAIINVSAERSKLGAFQNRLEHTINNLGTSAENLTAAESRIRDVDMAKEMMDQTKSSILAQASQAMLAQANQMPQGVLQLLR